MTDAYMLALENTNARLQMRIAELEAELEKKQYSTAMFKLGEKAGMERAAELASAATVNMSLSVCKAGEKIADAIRKEIDK